MDTKGFTLIISLFCMANLFAADTTWLPKTGGILTDAANWSVAPDNTSYAYIKTAQSAPLTWNNSFYLERLYLKVPRSILTLTGTPNSTCSYNRVYIEDETTVRLTSGILTQKPSGDRFFVGDNSSNNLLIIDGVNAELRTAPTKGGSHLAIGKNKGNNSVVVQNGGLFKGNLILAQGSSGIAGGNYNQFLVTGEGSRYLAETGESARIGIAGTGNGVVISNKAVMSVNDNVIVGDSDSMPPFLVGGNFLRICDHSTASIRDLFCGGYSDSNRVEILSGGSLSIINSLNFNRGGRNTEGNQLRISGMGSSLLMNDSRSIILGAFSNAVSDTVYVESNALFTSSCGKRFQVKIGVCGKNSRMVIRENGTVYGTNMPSAFLIGDSETASHCSLEISDGAKWETYAASSTADNILTVGDEGAFCSLITKRAALIAPHYKIIIGGSLNASNGLMQATDGANLNLRRIVCGDKAPNCALIVSNATIRIKETLDFGYSAISEIANPTNTLFQVSGAKTKITASEPFRLRNDARLSITIPPTGFESIPIQAPELQISSNAKIKVNLGKEFPQGKRVVLFRSTGKNLPANINLLLPPDAKNDSTEREIALICPSYKTTLLIIR